ncbi:uncharacterized protein LOC114910209 [Scleropages formosus]|uniref:Uncharacterized LOC114910209 n=1 Tax=Scleropages formosus TaxID=113540 RepID=A0A8C9TRA4_SCLFO|nr:uncharacterized protein LOC114910209 [Scleropages formosus]
MSPSLYVHYELVIHQFSIYCVSLLSINTFTCVVTQHEGQLHRKACDKKNLRNLTESLSLWQCTFNRTMWAEDHFSPLAGACLGSCTDPRENGTYIMYHGTTRQAAQQILESGFHQSPDGMLGRGVYVSRDLQKASRYPLHLPEHQRVVLKLKVRVGRVKKIDCQGHPLQKTWHDHGYDTAWCPPGCGMVKSGLEEDCVWDPNRITVTGAIYLCV